MACVIILLTTFQNAYTSQRCPCTDVEWQICLKQKALRSHPGKQLSNILLLLVRCGSFFAKLTDIKLQLSVWNLIGAKELPYPVIFMIQAKLLLLRQSPAAALFGPRRSFFTVEPRRHVNLRLHTCQVPGQGGGWGGEGGGGEGGGEGTGATWGGENYPRRSSALAAAVHVSCLTAAISVHRQTAAASRTSRSSFTLVFSLSLLLFFSPFLIRGSLRHRSQGLARGEGGEEGDGRGEEDRIVGLGREVLSFLLFRQNRCGCQRQLKSFDLFGRQCEGHGKMYLLDLCNIN